MIPFWRFRLVYTTHGALIASIRRFHIVNHSHPDLHSTDYWFLFICDRWLFQLAKKVGKTGAGGKSHLPVGSSGLGEVCRKKPKKFMHRDCHLHNVTTLQPWSGVFVCGFVLYSGKVVLSRIYGSFSIIQTMQNRRFSKYSCSKQIFNFPSNKHVFYIRIRFMECKCTFRLIP